MLATVAFSRPPHARRKPPTRFVANALPPWARLSDILPTACFAIASAKGINSRFNRAQIERSKPMPAKKSAKNYPSFPLANAATPLESAPAFAAVPSKSFRMTSFCSAAE